MFLPTFWITSNERTGCAGITTLSNDGNKTLANVIIDEPDVEYSGESETGLTTCVGSIEPPPAEEPPEPPEGTPPGPEDQFPPEARFNPSVCLPVVLPPGQKEVTYDVEVVGGGNVSGKVKSPGRGLVCAPLGAEQHPRHPHGITIDVARQRAYQVIEHSGLRWNADRTAFQVAYTTDEESGLTLAWDISDPKHPKYLKAYLNGHGAHEITVNQKNGLVFQGNHEDSHGVSPNIWVDVIDTTKSNPYGFIDTGYFHAVQGIDVDEDKNLVYGTDHVGELVFAFDASCKPQPNPADVVPPPAPPGYSLPSGDTNMKMGWNCIKWWVNVRPAFLAAFPDLTGITDPTAALPNVLHMHNGAADDKHHRSYSVIHAIHNAEHTGLAANEPPPGTEDEEGETAEHFLGRYVVEVDQPSAVNRTTKQATAPVHLIDLSHGYTIVDYPNIENIPDGLKTLEKSFVHAHFIWVDPLRDALLVTGEHTGNLGVVDTRTRQLEQVIGISRAIPDCVLPPPEDPTLPPEAEEPHVHGVTVQPLTGAVYVMDEGEHCFYESATVLKPKDEHHNNDHR